MEGNSTKLRLTVNVPDQRDVSEVAEILDLYFSSWSQASPTSFQAVTYSRKAVDCFLEMAEKADMPSISYSVEALDDGGDAFAAFASSKTAGFLIGLCLFALGFVSGSFLGW